MPLTFWPGMRGGAFDGVWAETSPAAARLARQRSDAMRFMVSEKPITADDGGHSNASRTISKNTTPAVNAAK